MASFEREFDETDLGALIAHEISQALDFDQSEISARRVRALEYLRGEMNDTPNRPHGSSVTSRDLADTVSWMLPGIMRVFMASDRMAEYEPVIHESADPNAAKQAEEHAEQASDYVSYVFFKDNPGYRIVYNATYDALLAGDGVVKAWWDETPTTDVSVHSRLTVEQVAELTDNPDIRILTQEKNKEPDLVTDPMTGQAVPVETYNIKIERTLSRGRLKVEAMAPENFLIDNGAVTVEEARFTAHRDPNITRSDLIEMGFNRKMVEDLSADSSITDQQSASARTSDSMLTDNSMMRSTQRIDLYECYLKVDVDGDGVAETIRVYYAGDAGAGTVLDWEVWEDEVPFTTIPCYPQPHRFESESVADRTMDVQKIKTILQRQALDNLYVSNLPMQEVEEGSVINPDILVSPKFGGLIWKKKGSLPIAIHVVPFVADKVFQATEYFDRIIEKRTGVSRTMMALDPETLQNQTATANQNARDASYSQNELVARNMAELGWRRLFRQILKLIVKHQDRPRTIRLRGKFVEMDPRHWNALMDVTVNTGLGSGSRDRDMMMLRTVLGDQVMVTDRLATSGFQREALEMLPRIRNTLIKAAESAGLKNPDAFWPDIDESHIQAMAQQAAEKAKQPPMEIQLEQMKGQTQGQIEQFKAQSAAQVEQVRVQAQAQLNQQQLQIDQQTEAMKAEGNRIKEAAQLEGDLQSKAAERENAIAIKSIEIAFEREKFGAEMMLRRDEMAMKFALEEKKIEESRMAREAAAKRPANRNQPAQQ
jgi:hypothetical protein